MHASNQLGNNLARKYKNEAQVVAMAASPNGGATWLPVPDEPVLRALLDLEEKHPEIVQNEWWPQDSGQWDQIMPHVIVNSFTRIHGSGFVYDHDTGRLRPPRRDTGY